MVTKKISLSVAQRSCRWRKKRKAALAELETLRNENLQLRRWLEQLTAKSRPETAEANHVGAC
jgi:hypothetical protein